MVPTDRVVMLTATSLLVTSYGARVAVGLGPRLIYRLRECREANNRDRLAARVF